MVTSWESLISENSNEKEWRLKVRPSGKTPRNQSWQCGEVKATREGELDTIYRASATLPSPLSPSLPP